VFACAGFFFLWRLSKLGINGELPSFSQEFGAGVAEVLCGAGKAGRDFFRDKKMATFVQQKSINT